MHHLVLESILRCDVDLRAELFRNVVVSGGNVMFDGFADRLQSELMGLTSSAVRVIALPERKYSTWIGGSVLASLSTFQSMLMTKEQYGEFGERYVNFICV
jgi:actin